MANSKLSRKNCSCKRAFTSHFVLQYATRGKIKIFILIHKLEFAVLLARQSCPFIVIVFADWPARKRCIVVKSAGTTMQRAKGKIEIFTHIHKLGSTALLARFRLARCGSNQDLLSCSLASGSLAAAATILKITV